MSENAINLKNLIPAEAALKHRLIWSDFKGIRFQIRYISRITLATIAEQCVIAAYDTKTKSRNKQLDSTKFARAIAETIVVNWENCTPKTLSNIMPINLDSMTDEQLNAPIPFTKENLFAVVENAHELDAYLQECSVDASMFRHAHSEDLEKNSLSSQSGN